MKGKKKQEFSRKIVPCGAMPSESFEGTTENPETQRRENNAIAREARRSAPMNPISGEEDRKPALVSSNENLEINKKIRTNLQNFCIFGIFTCYSLVRSKIPNQCFFFFNK